MSHLIYFPQQKLPIPESIDVPPRTGFFGGSPPSRDERVWMSLRDFYVEKLSILMHIQAVRTSWDDVDEIFGDALREYLTEQGVLGAR